MHIDRVSTIAGLVALTACSAGVTGEGGSTPMGGGTGGITANPSGGASNPAGSGGNATGDDVQQVLKPEPSGRPGLAPGERPSPA